MTVTQMKFNLIQKYGRNAKFELFNRVCFENLVTHFQLNNLYNLLMGDEQL